MSDLYPDDFGQYTYTSPWDEYRQHPGQAALARWSDINEFYKGVVVKNEMLLLGYLTAPIKSKRIKKKLLQQPEATYRIEACRRLYNYLSSISSLADHTMVLAKSYRETPFSDDYAKNLKKITELDEFWFLKDARDYSVHYRMLPIGYIVATGKIFDRDEGFIPVVYTGDLYDHDKWSKQAAKYIKTNFPQIELIPLIDKYAQAINEFYVWMFEQFEPLHGGEVAESEKVKHKILHGTK